MNINLNNVTLLGIDGAGNRPLITKALQLSKKNINYAKCLLLSPISSYNNMEGIEHFSIPKMTYLEWNNFVFSKLNSFITTDYFLYVDTDGFVIDHTLWTDSFLNYDYIGAPWTSNQHLDYCYEHNIKCYSPVGNGGFTLRSKKLLNELQKIQYDSKYPEDAFICLSNFNYLISKGINFCPQDLAFRFSTDPYNGSSFGFHGNKNIINTVSL